MEATTNLFYRDRYRVQQLFWETDYKIQNQGKENRPSLIRHCISSGEENLELIVKHEKKSGNVLLSAYCSSPRLLKVLYLDSQNSRIEESCYLAHDYFNVILKSSQFPKGTVRIQVCTESDQILETVSLKRAI